MNSDSLHVEVRGTKGNTQILLLHGWGSSAELMLPLAESLQDEFEVHAIDLPGHGRSPLPSSAYGVPESADWVAQYISKNMSKPTHIMGHSNGGRISLYMAARQEYAGLIDRLVLISPSGVKRKRTARFYFKKYLGKTLKFPFALLPPQLKKLGLSRLRDSLVWKSLGSSDYRTLSGVMQETFVKTVNCYLENDLGKVNSSVLLLRGSEDDAISDSQMKVMLNLIPDAGYVELPGAGHFGYLSHLNTVVKSSKSFFSTS